MVSDSPIRVANIPGNLAAMIAKEAVITAVSPMAMVHLIAIAMKKKGRPSGQRLMNPRRHVVMPTTRAPEMYIFFGPMVAI
uniref:Polysacc_synt_2 domain-containing protein n=1 Tax=Steinernema glaseri TaxID=37863 RepID=A0A1I8AS82_9BILA